MKKTFKEYGFWSMENRKPYYKELTVQSGKPVRFTGPQMTLSECKRHAAMNGFKALIHGRVRPEAQDGQVITIELTGPTDQSAVADELMNLSQMARRGYLPAIGGPALAITTRVTKQKRN